jgi:hypothetical protein
MAAEAKVAESEKIVFPRRIERTALLRHPRDPISFNVFVADERVSLRSAASKRKTDNNSKVQIPSYTGRIRRFSTEIFSNFRVCRTAGQRALSWRTITLTLQDRDVFHAHKKCTTPRTSCEIIFALWVTKWNCVSCAPFQHVLRIIWL